MADQVNEHTQVAHLSEMLPNPGNEKGATCEVCGAVLVCLSCGNHREPAQPQGRQEMTLGMIELMMVNPNVDSFVREKEQKLAALRRNAGDYKEALAEIERLRSALRGMVAAFGNPHTEEYVDGGASYRAAVSIVNVAREALALPAVRALEGK